MTTPFDNKSLTPKDYIFCLGQTESGYDIICDAEPLEWAEGVIEINRDLKAGGVFTLFNVNSLTFIGNGGKYLRDRFDADEINALTYLFIYWFDITTRTYIKFPGIFQAKFQTYSIKKVGNFAFGVNVEFIRTGNYQKLIDRKGLKLNLSKNTTVDGMILEQKTDFDVISKIKIPALNSSLAGSLKGRGLKATDTLYSLYALVEGYNSLPFSIISSDFAESQRVLFESGQAAITDLTPLIYDCASDRTLSFRLSVYVMVDNDYATDVLVLKYAVNHNGVITEYTTTAPAFGDSAGLYHLQATFTVDLLTGDDLYLYIHQTDQNDGGQSHIIRPTLSNPANEYATEVSFVQPIVNTDEVTVDGLPIYEAIELASSMILNQRYPIYSEFFGREDVKYTDSDYYLSENSSRFAHILSGLNIRGLTIQDADSRLNISWEELIKSISAMYNIGYGFETISGSERLRIEDRNFFFDPNEGLDLSGRISELDIEKTYMPELAYIQVNAGYDNEVFRSINGRGEYNTKQTRTLEISADQELDLVSVVRADTIGIVNCLEKSIQLTGSEDIDEDEKVFIIKSQKEDTTPTLNEWKVETNELITIENNSSLFEDGSLNLYFSPLRNMIRNRDHITAAMQKQLSAVLRFQTSGKLSNLETSGEGYSFNVKENENITINQLNEISAPRFKPIKLIVTSEFFKTDLSYLYQNDVNNKLNLYRKVKLTDTISGYILNLKMKNNENKATIELIQAL